MSRPAVSVVMPFAGSRAAAEAALVTLRGLAVGPEDERILADNGGSLGELPASSLRESGIVVVPVDGERSPSHARNVGAERARGEWILFLDADTRAPADLLDRYLADRVDPDVGALAGAVVAAAGATTFAARYGAAKSFLNQDAHLAHPYLPRAVAANLLVRRAAFEAVGGFYEGVRAAEDTDLSWRLQRAGWRLLPRPEAEVQHAYRTSVRALRRQWRGYAAGRAWLARRYDGFVPEPALVRAAGRIAHRRRPATETSPPAQTPQAPPRTRLERGGFLAIDALLGIEELAGLALSNRPPHDGHVPAQVVLVAERFPGRDDPLAEFALSLAGARVEAAARPEAVHRAAVRTLSIDYREDDGAAQRAGALLALAVRHPVRILAELLLRAPAPAAHPAPTLAALAPAAARLRRDRGARVIPLGGAEARAVAVRLGHLAGRPVDA